MLGVRLRLCRLGRGVGRGGRPLFDGGMDGWNGQWYFALCCGLQLCVAAVGCNGVQYVKWCWKWAIDVDWSLSLEVCVYDFIYL